jgi:hypothetical protein
MLNINNIEFPERHEKPAVGNKVALRSLFYNDGQLVDPADVSSVTVYKYSDYSTSALFDSDNLLSATPIMHFEPSGSAPDDVSLYTGSWGTPIGGPTDFQHASGVFKLKTGDFVAPLRLDKGLSGVWQGTQLDASANVSGAVKYIDVWTVKLLAGSKYQSFINSFTLFEDTFFTTTEPLIVKTNAKLSNKHLRLGEIIDLKVPVDITVENRNIDQSIINTLKSTLITSGAFKVTKVNDNDTLDGPFTVSGYSDTSSTVNVTSDGTLIWQWDTNNIPTSSNFGEAKGTYAVQVQYWANGQKVISPRFYLRVD